MKDLTIQLENRPGALAEMGEALGQAGVSAEGGGAFVVNGHGVAHFLFHDAAAARRALEAVGIAQRMLELSVDHRAGRKRGCRPTTGPGRAGSAGQDRAPNG